MAVDTTSRPSGRLRGSVGRTEPSLRVLAASPGTRRDAERISQVVPDALAPCVEGIAMADEAIAASERIVMAALADAPMAVVHEAQRMATRLVSCREELRRLAGLIEPRPA